MTSCIDKLKASLQTDGVDAVQKFKEAHLAEGLDDVMAERMAARDYLQTLGNERKNLHQRIKAAGGAIPARAERLAQSNQQQAPTLYSSLAKFISTVNLPQFKNNGSARGADIWAKLKSAPLKKEELQWVGIEEFLTIDPDAKFTRDQVVAFAQANGVKVETVVADKLETTDEIEWSPAEEEDDSSASEKIFNELVSQGWDEAEALERAAEIYADDPNLVIEAEEIPLRIEGSNRTGWTLYNTMYNESVADAASLNEIQIQAIRYAQDNNMLMDASNPQVAKWGEYVMDGPHSNYRELKLTLPDVEGDFVYNSHFPDRNVVAFLRVDDRNIALGENPSYVPAEMPPIPPNYKRFNAPYARMYAQIQQEIKDNTEVVEQVTAEIREVVVEGLANETPEFAEMVLNDQSRWAEVVYRFHNPDTEKGQEVAGWQFAKQSLRNLQSDLATTESDFITQWKKQEQAKKFNQTKSFFIEEFQSDWHQQGRKKGYQGLSVDEQKRKENLDSKSMIDWSEADIDWYNDRVNSQQDEGVPDAPFKDDAWLSLGMKKAIIEAVNGGYDSIGWPNAEVLGERWSSNYLELYRNQYDKKMPSVAKKLMGAEAVLMNEDGTPFVKPDNSSKYSIDSRSENDFYVWDNEAGRVAKINLDSEAEAKKWIDNVDAEPGYWVIPITDQLKKKVMEEGGLPLFQTGDVTARGYYEPQNVTIRLTEAADLSTFLHEFAHFMYEMELKAGGKTRDSIHNWFRRNAEDVALEANGYLNGRDGDLAQQSLDEYGGLHRPPGKDNGAPGHDLTGAGNIYPDDVYSMNGARYYGAGESYDAQTFAIAQSLKGKPNAPVTIYRAIPTGLTTAEKLSKLEKQMAAYMKRGTVPGDTNLQGSRWYDWAFDERARLQALPVEQDAKITINPGDWVSINRQYVKEHGESSLNGEYRIISKKVKAKEIFTNGDSIHEWGYWPAGTEEKFEQSQGTPDPQEGRVTPDDVIRFLDLGNSGDESKDKAIRRAVHEQFARGFEQYLREGKAPSVELRNAFRIFARWLTEIYRKLKSVLNTKLDDEMRQVFDRLLATEEQIAAAEARGRAKPMFDSQDTSPMSPAQFRDYQIQNEKVANSATEKLRDKVLGELTRQTKEWWSAEKVDLVAEETERLKAEPAYKAMIALRSGDLKLDHAEVKVRVGQKNINKAGVESVRIPPVLNGMTAKGGNGLPLDDVAAFLGFHSGDELLYTLMNTQPLAEAAQDAAEQRMLDQHGDILNDGTLEEEANRAVQNEERGKLLIMELRALSKKSRIPKLDIETVKASAREHIEAMPYSAIHPGKYRAAEIRFAKESADAHAKGDVEGAAFAKSQQVLNHYYGIAAQAAQDDVNGIVKFMARYNTKTVKEEIMKAEGGYWEQIVKILGRFEFRKSASVRLVNQNNIALQSWAEAKMDADGDNLQLTPEVLDELYTLHWKNVPLSVLKGVRDSVKNIEHVARYSNTVNLLGEEMTHKRLVQNWIDHVNSKVKTKFKTQRTSIVENKNHLRWAMAGMTKIPFLSSWLDGGERVGMTHNILNQQFTDALDSEHKLWDQVGTSIVNALENRSKEDLKRHNTKIFIPEIKVGEHDGNLFGHQIIAVALNVGNQENLRKMLLGEGWANPDDDTTITMDNPQLQAILKHMTESDWNLVEMIWERIDVLYPMLADVHRRTSGLTPPKVDATPFTLPNGRQIGGGYYPVKYDPKRSSQAALNDEKKANNVDSMFGGSGSLHASVGAGATHTRTAYYAPIRLDLAVVPNHIQETIHYITHHDAVRSVNKFLRNQQVRQTITEKMGEYEYNQLLSWLNDVAKDGREAPNKSFVDAAFSRLRFGLTLGMMGFKASTGIMQLSGLSTAAAELGIGNVMRALRAILFSENSIKESWQFMLDNSKVMNHRTRTMDREMRSALERLESKKGIAAAIQETSMKHIMMIQSYGVDLPTWYAGYIKELKSSGDEAKAFKYADWAVENLQGSGATKDMPSILRNQTGTHRLFTMFMTYFSVLWNLERDAVRGAALGQYSITGTAAKAMFLIAIPVIYEMWARGEYEAGDDEDEDDAIQKTLTKIAIYPLQSIPFVRDAVGGVFGEFGYTMTPAASVLEKGFAGYKQIKDRAFTDEEITAGAVEGAVKLTAAFAGVPGVNQIWASGEHIYQVMEEGEDLTVRELLYGPKPE